MCVRNRTRLLISFPLAITAKIWKTLKAEDFTPQASTPNTAPFSRESIGPLTTPIAVRIRSMNVVLNVVELVREICQAEDPTYPVEYIYAIV